MESTAATPAPVEGVSPRKTRKGSKKHREEGSETSANENRHPDTEQPPDLRSDSPPQTMDDEHSVVENLTSSVIMPSGNESRPTPSRPTTRGTTRSKHTSNDPQKAKITTLVNMAFSGNAPELMDAVEDCEACFPCVMSQTITHGSKQLPAAELLQEILQRTDAKTTAQPVPTQERTFDSVRDTVFAGALIGSSEILEACLKNGADLAISDATGRNIFHCLGAIGDASLLRKVLRRLERTHGRSDDRKGDSGERKGTSGSQPDATATDKPTFSQLLNQVDNRGWTPLLTTVARCNEDAVEALLVYQQVNLETPIAHTCPPCLGQEPVESSALHVAALRGHAGIAKRLMAHGAAMNATDSMMRNIFHYAAAMADHDAASSFFGAMLKESQFDPQMLMQLDRHNRSPIFIAIAWGNMHLAEKMVHHAKTASLPAQGEGAQDQPFTLTGCILAPDTWTLTPFHVAYLRRHFSVLFRVSKLWATYRSAEDPPTFVEGLKKYSPVEIDASMNASKALSVVVNDKKLISRWLEQDLSPLERAAYHSIRCCLQLEGKQVADTQLLRAVRRIGPEMCLRALGKAAETAEKSVPPAPPRAPIAKRGPSEIAYYRSLREMVQAEFSATEIRSALRFVLGDNYNKTPTSGSKVRAEFEAPVATGPMERVPVPASTRVAAGHVTKRGAEKQPLRSMGSMMGGSRAGGFAAPLTGASPRTVVPPSSLNPSAAIRVTPDRSVGERKTPSQVNGRTSPPHLPQPSLNSSRLTRSTVQGSGGSPGFMSMTRSSANLFRNTTAPRPPTKTAVTAKVMPASLRGSQMVPQKSTSRTNAGKRAGQSDAGSNQPPLPTADDFEIPQHASEVSFESNSESRSIQAS